MSLPANRSRSPHKLSLLNSAPPGHGIAFRVANRMILTDLPAELLEALVQEMIYTVSIRDAVHLRLVNSDFR